MMRSRSPDEPRRAVSLSIYYFAYGSNMHPERLARRVPLAEPVETAVLPNHLLCFHKRGRDGSGKGNIVPASGRRVLGVLYRTGRQQLRNLDRAEGRGYVRCRVRVIGLSSGKAFGAFTYRARASAMDDRMTPYDWYMALVVSGAEWHDLPAAYTDTLRGLPSRGDRNPRRDRHHLTIAASSRRPVGRRRKSPLASRRGRN
jgi:hypothetical protein